MTRVALKGLLGRKVRAVLTGLAVVLGVAMVSGSFVLTDTISKAFTSIFSSAYDHTDAVVSGKKLVDYSSSGNATVSQATLERIRRQPYVAAAAGAIADLSGDSTHAKLIGHDGKAIDHSGAPTFGFGIDTSQPRFNPLKLEAGRWAMAPDEVVIDPDTAKNEHFSVGDTIGVAAVGPVQRFRIVGIAKYGDVESLGGATFAVFTVPEARRLMHIDGYTTIAVAAAHGVSQDELAGRLQRLVPSGTVKTATEQAASDKKGVAGFLTFIRSFLLGFGGIALFVGAFVIFNTLSITVAQRTRELATLRTIGASRRQVLRSVILESAALGALASVIGLLAGFGLAKGLSSLFGALGLGLPQAAPVYATHTFVVSLLLGVVVTVLAGVVPAVRATRGAPIAAARGGLPQKVRSRRATIVGVVLLALAAFLLGYAVTGNRLGSGSSLLALALGALALITGTAGVASRLVSTLAWLFGAPARRWGGAAGRIASENAVRNPQRTASTAAALMIGIALVSFVAVLGKGVHDSMNNAISGQFPAQWIVTSKNGWSGYPVSAGAALAKAPGVARSTEIRGDRGLIGDTQVNVNGVDPSTVDGLYRFGWKRGTTAAALAELQSGGAILKETFAKKNHLTQLGQRFVLLGSSGKRVALHVAGFYESSRIAELLGGVIVAQREFDAAFPRAMDQFTLIDGTPTKAALQRSLAVFPDTKVQTHDEFVKNQTSFMNSILNLLYVLLALSVVVSLFGMINTLVLSVWERTREVGMLRAIGLSRRQTRRMIRQESVVTGLIGAGLGLPVGLVLAYAVTHALSRFGVAFELQATTLVKFLVIGVAAGVLAAVAPARRASRLNVLAALQYE
ncbi:MAG: ABC transporter permease [Actinomycetota bacterium]